MFTSFEDKGKIFTNIVTKEPVEVIIQTNIHHIHGFVHVRPDDRIKDEINLNERFLAVTDATVSSNTGEELFKVDFLAVNREQIIWIYPKEEPLDLDES
ncbi:MAG: hypothetical protein JEZ00_03565 [Anaerolineaceae bacterium]|nr:hypothetical protein [Anaerolineaceae bacterium]